jgi:hypothetical protein
VSEGEQKRLIAPADLPRRLAVSMRNRSGITALHFSRTPELTGLACGAIFPASRVPGGTRGESKNAGNAHENNEAAGKLYREFQSAGNAQIFFNRGHRFLSCGAVCISS